MTGEQGYDFPVIYRLGYPNMGNNGYSLTNPPSNPDDGGLDPQVEATLLRHGNYDYFNHATIWDAAISDHVIPNSLYLTSKPAWFGSVTWPPIGPDVAGLVNKIPAQIRYEAMSGGDTTPPAAPTGVKVN